jgi:hypothetical protein
MTTALEWKIDELRSDYQTVTGRPFSHFYCPILFRDDDTSLCRAHIVNSAFEESNRSWTVQRADVDNFYGRVFEADFVNIQYWEQSPDRVISDASLSNRLRPEIRLGGEVVKHFLARGPVPDHFTEAVAGGGIRLGLKIQRNEAATAMSEGCEIQIGQDARLPALVSLLKAAHLTLFYLLGYPYALSAGGRFLGQTVLGNFFLQNQGLDKAHVLKNAVSHFSEYSNMVRPLLGAPIEVQGTASDRRLFVCFCEPQTPWARIVFIRTSKLRHAVLVPVLEEPSAVARFKMFLRGECGHIRASLCRVAGDGCLVDEQSETLMWPEAEFL